jgi:flagellar protein FliJ
MNRANSFVRERYDAMTKARSIAAIETAWRDMDSIVMALDRYVAAEEVRTGITDLKHVTYSTAAIAARSRSSNLKQSVIELKAKLLVATAEHNSALAKLTALEKRQDAAQSELPVTGTDTDQAAIV